MQDRIINYLKESYRPTTIILHGSRARGMEREHSDWDFILLYDGEPHAQNGREVIDGQNIELFVGSLPLDDIEGLLHKLQGAIVLFESAGEGTELLTKAKQELAKGVHWSPEKVTDHKLWVEGRVNGMKENLDRPIIFYKYFADFYHRIFNYWYWLKQNQHSQPVYIAIGEVAGIDPEFYALIEQLTDETTTLEDKARLADEVKVYLFS